MSTSSDPNLDSIEEKWAYSLSSKPLSPAEKSLLQKGPEFAITPTTPQSLTILVIPSTFVTLLVRTLPP